MTAGQPTLRERKKQATREALRTAALRLALKHGPDNVRVDDIAEAAGVSPRTYNNYFSSREQAIVAAVTAQRASQVAAAVLARPAEVGLADAVIDAVVGQYADQGEHAPEALLMIAASPALRACYVDTVTTIEGPLAEAITERCPDVDRLTAQVLAAGLGAAAKVALRQWLQSADVAPSMPGFVVPSGSLPDLVRAALTPFAPALDAAAVGPPAADPR
ncbi:TetR family transcriptional regulator [Micromonospora qiuiae]|uniref:TetR family transcriptional regulator n=1 Tax=Micromonospora qiuiae TaxID=502268 RepID=A0ABQ4JCD0_9ACTN|nr:TetR/AcrR family transcriptional regulator [Micromonospora qiuiae]GIJ27822.1 TetR family transcriptional regulator [Micromonospora qiuiae]